MSELHIVTIDDLRQYGHYMFNLLLALKPEVVTVRKFWSEEDTWSDGAETRVIRPARWITMIKMPDGKYIELFPHELEALQERHTIVWETEVTR